MRVCAGVDALVVSLVHNTEAQTVAHARITELRRQTYHELRARVGQPETTKVVDDSGTTCQVDVELFPRRSNKRQPFAWTVAVDDGGWRAFVPVTDDVMIAPEGSFVGE